MAQQHQHNVLIIGAGSAGISTAARLNHAGVDNIAIIDPASMHYYQPLWTLVGGGRAPMGKSGRPQSSLIPDGVRWIRESAQSIDPDAQTVTTDNGVHQYRQLIVCPGIQLDWDKIPGMIEALNTSEVSSNYSRDLAPKTWDLIQQTRSGTAVFTMPAGPIKCAGAPQKIAYLAADYWREQGVLDDIRVVLVLPTPGMFGVKEFSDELEKVVADYGIEVHKNSELTQVDADGRRARITNNAAETTEDIEYDMMHVVPPQSAPDWLKATPLAVPDSPTGYVDIDKNTLQHTRYPNIFALGDAGSSPNSKTGAAIRKQAPVVVSNLLAARQSKALPASYDGYASCPLTTSRHSMLLAEFDYSMRPHPSFPVIDTTKSRRDMWYLKRYGLPFMYWNLMLRGRV
ncbi:NAD(P)/FAD-dependent oxidoreductase [Allobranchiibius sp. GilTou73]|nr:FAD/NAD(P)-binding oxidoreductase [Allobranchiibius sp. GilTou73]UIJ36562.1 NAD(P)/FAD-dependent oxidoreductase [Allobranchiibius sp. GilTou73]